VVLFFYGVFPILSLGLKHLELFICGADEVSQNVAAYEEKGNSFSGVVTINTSLSQEAAFSITSSLRLPVRLQQRRFYIECPERMDLTHPEERQVRERTEKLFGFVKNCANEEGTAHILLHCHAGISRSPAFALLLLCVAMPLESPQSLVKKILNLKPDADIHMGIIKVGDRMLGFRGTLLQAIEENPTLRPKLVRRGHRFSIEN